MKHLVEAALAASLLTGCAGTYKKIAVGVVVASDRFADDIAADWSSRTDERIDYCRESLAVPSTPDQRRECLGDFNPTNTMKLIVAVETLVAVQTAIKAAAECEELAVCAQEADWKELADSARAAWAGLKPFVLKIQAGD